MKIGLITLSASDNCGSLLQTYALKMALEEYGEVDVINFSSKESHAIYDVPLVKGDESNEYKNRINAMRSASEDYITFRREYIGITGKEYFYKDLPEIEKLYDVVVVGSDQVWNVEMVDFSEAFFLGWCTSKKVAYAPSLGGRHLRQSNNYNCIKEWLEDFSFISVREEVGKQCLEEVLGVRVPKVIDPTLLVPDETWNKLISEPLIKGDYIFYYSWAYCEDSTSKIVSDEAKRLGMPVYVIDARKWLNRNAEKWGFTLFEGTGPIIFLNLMRYARRCFVESFHGMIFAYIFKKDFWLLDTHERVSELDTRLMEFVSLLGAEDRIVTEYNYNYRVMDKPFEYVKNKRISELKQESEYYLRQALREEQK